MGAYKIITITALMVEVINKYLTAFIFLSHIKYRQAIRNIVINTYKKEGIV